MANALWNFIISLAGSDKWSQKLAESSASRTDGPFATLEGEWLAGSTAIFHRIWQNNF